MLLLGSIPAVVDEFSKGALRLCWLGFCWLHTLPRPYCNRIHHPILIVGCQTAIFVLMTCSSPAWLISVVFALSRMRSQIPGIPSCDKIGGVVRVDDKIRVVSKPSISLTS